MLYAKRNRDLTLYLYLFFLLNILILFCLNLYGYKESNLSNNYVQVELKKEVSKEALENSEKVILSLKEVKKVRYYSKEEALINLSNELGVNVKSEIPDIFIVTVSDLNGGRILEEALKDDISIEKVHINEKLLLDSEKVDKGYKIAILALLIVAVLPLVIEIPIAHRRLVQNNFVYQYLKAKDRKNRGEILKEAKKITIIPTIFLATFGVALAFAIYYLFIYLTKDFNLVKLEFSYLKTLLILFGVTGFMYILSITSAYLVKPEEKRGR